MKNIRKLSLTSILMIISIFSVVQVNAGTIENEIDSCTLISGEIICEMTEGLQSDYVLIKVPSAWIDNSYIDLEIEFQFEDLLHPGTYISYYTTTIAMTSLETEWIYINTNDFETDWSHPHKLVFNWIPDVHITFTSAYVTVLDNEFSVSSDESIVSLFNTLSATYLEGKTEGLEEGYINGYDDGEVNGYTQGYEEGYTDGGEYYENQITYNYIPNLKEDTNGDGYDDTSYSYGYTAGQNDIENNNLGFIINLLSLLLGFMVNVILFILTLEVAGTSLLTIIIFMASVFTPIIILAMIKKGS